MFHQDNALQTFADRIGCGDAPLNRVRETLEASLIPLVRRVLRTGAGNPQLVRWVQTTLPQVDPERAAPSLARLLCATLLRQRTPRREVGAMDTVVGA